MRSTLKVYADALTPNPVWAGSVITRVLPAHTVPQGEGRKISKAAY